MSSDHLVPVVDLTPWFNNSDTVNAGEYLRWKIDAITMPVDGP